MIVRDILLQLATVAALWTLLYVILYQQIIKPLLAMHFYRRQGIQCQFVPLTGSSPIDSDNVRKHGDFYHGWLEKIFGKAPRPRLFCKNIGSNCALVLTDPALVR